MRDPAALRAYVERDWSAFARDETRTWRDTSPAERFRVAAELRRQVVDARPDWPSDEERAEDLATHLRVIDALRRVPRRAR